MQVNQTSKRMEYSGSTMRMAKSMIDLPNGGQVLMDARTFDNIKLRLDDLYAAISHGPDMTAIERNCRSGRNRGCQLQYCSGPQCVDDQHFHAQAEPGNSSACLSHDTCCSNI